MTRVEQLEQQIVQLDPEEFTQLREWLMEQDWPGGTFGSSVMPLRAHWIGWRNRRWPAMPPASRGSFEPSHSPEFWEAVDRLRREIQALARSNYELLKADHRHPSLHFEKVAEYWSVRAGLPLRLLQRYRTRCPPE